MTRALGWTLGAMLLAGRAAAQQPASGRPCLFALDSAERRLTAVTVFANNQNFDAAGNVHMRCQGQPVYLRADSVSVISGDFFRFFGHVVYRDPSYRVDADTLYYTRRTEKIEARGHVLALDKASGSTLAGPSVDYLRQAKGVNDSASMLAQLRPTVRYFGRTAPRDTLTSSPYLLTADVLHGFGQSHLWGNGKVTIERDSLLGDGDSLSFVRGKTGTGRLMGAIATLRRRGQDSFTVSGEELRLGLVDDQVKELRAFRRAVVDRGITEIHGDTITMALDHDKLARTVAWAHKDGATLHSAGYDVQGDSLAIDSPGELLREVRVFGRGAIMSPRDSTMPKLTPAAVPGDSATPAADMTRNTLWGDRVVASFAQADSAGTKVTRLHSLDAFGAARSLFARTVVKNGRPTPSINYTRADTIHVRMNGADSAGVAAVQAYGHVDGVQLETASLRRPGRDSTRTPVQIPSVLHP